MSAGAGSVAMHLAAYGGRDDGLFVGAMLDSVFFPAQPPVAELEYQFSRTLETTGCDGDVDHMECLRSLDVATLQTAGNVVQSFPGREGLPNFYWTPTVDGEFLTDLPYELFRRGEFIKVPLLAGTDTDGGLLRRAPFLTPS
jgi:carboxylesterase type B